MTTSTSTSGAGAGPARRAVHGSLYCLPADILDEGATPVLRNAAERAGLTGVTVAASYHASLDVYPHNPRRRVADMAPGAFYHVSPAVYPGRLRPTVSRSAAGRDLLAEACAAAGPLGLEVAAWAVFLHRDDWRGRRGEVQENCFGDLFRGRLCPASPAVRDYVVAMVGELCGYPVTTLRAESLNYQGVSHGGHHERSLDSYGETAAFLLGMCFCRYCADAGAGRGVDVPRLAARCRHYLTQIFDSVAPARAADARALTDACGADLPGYLRARAATVTSLAAQAAARARQAGVTLSYLDDTIPLQAYATGRGFDPGHDAIRWQLGGEPAALAAAGVGLEIPAYLAGPADVATALDWYRERAPLPARLSVILRPGPPDTPAPDTPATGAGLPPGSLAEKVAAVTARGCAELSFYAYGLYRLAALDQIRAALAAS